MKFAWQIADGMSYLSWIPVSNILTELACIAGIEGGGERRGGEG